MGFIDSIKERAKQNKKTIVLPESMDRRTWEAVEIILKEGIANVIVLPGENEMESLALGALRIMKGEEKAKVFEG